MPAADFFHGTIELVEDDVGVPVLEGEDATSRALAERVEVLRADGLVTPPSRTRLLT